MAELWRWLYAITNTILTGTMIVNGVRILRHFKNNESITTAAFAWKETVSAFKLLSASLFSFAGVTLLVAFDVIPRLYFYEFSITVFFAGMAYFMHAMVDITTEPD